MYIPNLEMKVVGTYMPPKGFKLSAPRLTATDFLLNQNYDPIGGRH